MPKPAFIRTALYRLLRRYGVSLDLYNVLESDTNRTSGLRTKTVEKKAIKRALVLDATKDTKFEYDLSYIMAARPFSMGGHFDLKTRWFIVSIKDMGDFDLKDTGDLSYVVYAGEKYAVKKSRKFDEKQAYVIVGEHIAGDPFPQVHDKKLFDWATIADTLEKDGEQHLFDTGSFFDVANAGTTPYGYSVGSLGDSLAVSQAVTVAMSDTMDAQESQVETSDLLIAISDGFMEEV